MRLMQELKKLEAFESGSVETVYTQQSAIL
jgi:hypothetical protein